MADKKITELTALTSVDVDQNDLLVIVDSPSSTPITKKITVGNLLGGVKYTANTNTSSNVTALKVTAKADTANVNALFTAAQFSLELSNASNILADGAVGNNGPYGISIEHSNTVARSAGSRPVAFINFRETANVASANAELSTKYLFDIGMNGFGNVSFSSANSNTLVMVTSSNAAAGSANAAPTHKIKVRINGTEYWLLASSTAN